MLSVLFIGLRMRALQITSQKGAPQGWAQQGMFLCTYSLMAQARRTACGGRRLAGWRLGSASGFRSCCAWSESHLLPSELLSRFADSRTGDLKDPRGLQGTPEGAYGIGRSLRSHSAAPEIHCPHVLENTTPQRPKHLLKCSEHLPKHPRC